MLADGTTAIAEPAASVVRRIFAERQAGKTIAGIAEGLNADGVPGPTGGKWHLSAGVSLESHSDTTFLHVHQVSH